MPPPRSIVIDGTPCVSAAAAARARGFHPDYIARLCRRGVIRGYLLGRAWYLEPTSLESFLAAASLQRAKRREETRDQRRRERKLGRILQPSATPPARPADAASSGT